jgi:hypothetical protein
MSEITEAPFEMANLPPRLTGLPMVVWVSERGNAPHDVRVKVCRVHSERMQWNNTASVAVRPQPHLASGRLSSADLAVVGDWIRLNEAVLIDYWEERIFTDELLSRLRKLP